MSSAKPLSTAAPLSILRPKAESAEYHGETSAATWHIFINCTDRPADLYYFYESTSEASEGEGSINCKNKKTTMVKHGSIEPGSNLYIGQSFFAAWACMCQCMHVP